MRIHHSCLVDIGFLKGLRGLDGEELDVDIGPVQGGALFGELPYIAGVEAVAVHHNRDLDAGVLGEVGDEAGIQDVPVDPVRLDPPSRHG